MYYCNVGINKDLNEDVFTVKYNIKNIIPFCAFNPDSWFCVDENKTCFVLPMYVS